MLNNVFKRDLWGWGGGGGAEGEGGGDIHGVEYWEIRKETWSATCILNVILFDIFVARDLIALQYTFRICELSPLGCYVILLYHIYLHFLNFQTC